MRFRDYSGSSLAPRADSHQAARSVSHPGSVHPAHCHSTSLWAWLESESQRSRLRAGGGHRSSRPLAAGRFPGN